MKKYTTPNFEKLYIQTKDIITVSTAESGEIPQISLEDFMTPEA